MKSLEEMKAEFAARGGVVTTVDVGIAYGVDAEADKAKRRDAREQREYEATEQHAERYAENVREAYHVGGYAGRNAFMRGAR